MTVKQYLKSLEHKQKDDMLKLHELITKASPKTKPKLWNYSGNIIGYGTYQYKYKSGREGEWFVVGLSARKQYISLYAMASKDGKYITDLYKKDLSPAKLGKSCINIKDLSAMDYK